MSNTEQMVSELLPCPFCKAAMHIESNRDWHRVMGEHDEECVFLDPETMMVPATDEQRELLVRDWNRRKKSAAQHQGEPVALAIPEECPHLIVFDDTEVASLMFSGAGARAAALKKWDAISTSWNAHLFVRVARNSRDDGHPCATVADAGEVERLVSANTEYARRHLEQQAEVERLRLEIEQLRFSLEAHDHESVQDDCARAENRALSDEVERLTRKCKNADLALRVQTENCERLRKERQRMDGALVACANERDTLRAQLAECEAMAAMIAEREWAEHAGNGPVSSKVEAAFTQLHNELHESGENLAERVAALDAMTEIATGYKRDLDEAHALLKTHTDHVAQLCDVMFRHGLGMDKEAETKIYAALAQQQIVFALLSASAEPKSCGACSNGCINGCQLEKDSPEYPRIHFVRAHKHTCANVQPGSTSADICDCGAVVDGSSVQAEPSAPVEIDHDALVAAACVLRSQGLGNLSEAVEVARAALERMP